MSNNLPRKFNACDTETTGLIVRKPEDVLSVCLVDKNGSTVYTKLDEEELDIVRAKAQTTYFAMHNAAFDLHVLENVLGIEVPFFLDTMVLSYLLMGPSEMQEHGLAACAKYVGRRKFEKPERFDQLSEYLIEYTIEDTEITYELVEFFRPIFEAEPEIFKEYFWNVELPYVRIISALQNAGMYVDKKAVADLRAEYTLAERAAYDQCQEIAGGFPGAIKKYKPQLLLHRRQHVTPSGKQILKNIYVGYDDSNGEMTYDHCTIEPFNPNSPDQVSKKLISLYGWKPDKFSDKTGKPSTGKQVLEELNYPLASVVREYKQYSKLVSTYLNKFMDVEERLYGSFLQCQTVTRRLSSSKPNLQNIPARGEKGADIRKCITAAPGKKLLVGDLDRIEVVMLAFYVECYTGVDKYSKIIKNREDFHQINSDTWGLTDLFGAAAGRSKAKNGIFCFIYGGGTVKFSETISVPTKTGKKILESMKDTSPELFELRDLLLQETEESGGRFYDHFGGPFFLPNITSKNNELYAEAARQSFNYRLQGTAGTVFKICQLDAWDDPWIRRHLLPINVVHDEAIYEVDEDLAEEGRERVQHYFNREDLMVSGDIMVPIFCEFHIGDNWYDAKGA